MGRKAPRKRLRAYVIRPPTGAAAPERLSALRFPHLVRETANLGELMPREKEAACVCRCRWQKARGVVPTGTPRQRQRKMVGTTRFARTLHFAETRLITIVLTYWDSLMFDLDAGARAPHITAS